MTPPSPLSPSAYLAASPLFSGISDAGLAALDAAATWLAVAGGTTLFEQGDAADALYVLARGTLHVLVRDAAGDVHRVEYLGAGALVGELGVLLGEERSATIRAIRDAELLRVPRETFIRLLETETALGAAVSRLLGQRLKRTTTRPRVHLRARTVALLPLGGRPVPPGFVASLLTAMIRQGATASHLSSESLDRDMGAGASGASRGEAVDSQIMELCDRLEREHSRVIYEGNPVATPWTERCLRQADLVLLIANATDPPAPGDLERHAAEGRPPASMELVLLHKDDKPVSGTIEWLRGRPTVRHHHVHTGRADSYDRLARFVNGTAGGLVLSGGGARAYAHIGVLKALGEAGIAVDVIGGSSMGAIIAAQHAAGFDVETMIELNRRSFSGTDLSDLTMPAVALRKGRSTVRRLQAMFGERQIEDLPLRYFCVTSDLTHARALVHDRGALWLWTRASCAIPGLVPPVPSDGGLLVDGGLLNNLPADVMRQRCSGAVIAVNVTPTVDLATDVPLVADMSGWPTLWQMLVAGAQKTAFPTIAAILSRTVFVASVRDAQEQRQHCDLYLQPALDGIGMGDFTAIDRIVEAGYRHAAARLAAWSLRGTHVRPS